MPSRVFDVDIDVNNHQLLNMLMQLVAGTPSSPAEGRLWYDSTAKRLKFRTDAATIDPTDRSVHSGTQAASTISDLASVVKAYRLDEFAAPNTDLSIGTHKLVNVTDGSADSDAATVGQLNSVSAGQTWKQTARVATNAALPAHTRSGNILTASANAALTVDGVTVAVADRVLVKDEGSGTHLENGIYTVTATGAAGAVWVLTRATDADVSAEVKAGLTVPVAEGSANADTIWILTTNNAITLNTTAITFGPLPLPSVTGGAGLVKTGNVLDVGAGTGISGGADAVGIDTTLVARYKTFTFGDGAATSFVLNHALGNQWVQAQVIRNASPFDEIEVAIERTDANNVTVRTSSTWASNGLKATVVG